MQELRFVLIIVGALAIAALLFHGLWTSRKDGKAKFGDKPLKKMKREESEVASPVAVNPFALAADVDKKHRKEPAISFDSPSASEPDPLRRLDIDPLIDSVGENLDEADETAFPEAVSEVQPKPITPAVEPVEQAPVEEDFEVIVLNVHCAGSEPFVGTKLFDSMQQNGLFYGEMDIYHRHADLSGTGKVLFSVANMLQPGTLKHDDPHTFTTKGISFFMTLPCFGDEEQNFKLMLRTAQQIADDLGGHVLDDKRNLLTPSRLDQYREQIKQFKAQRA